MSQYNFNQKFLDPEKVLFRAGLSAGETIADLGAGSGFYALAAGKVVGQKGQVYAVDLLETALAHIVADARLRMLKNIRTVRADLEQPNSIGAIPDASCDIVILGNIMHQLKNQKNMLTETYRILKTGGRVLIVDWNETPGPIGPKHKERIPESESKKQIEAAGFKFSSNIDTDPFHYGLTFIK